MLETSLFYTFVVAWCYVDTKLFHKKWLIPEHLTKISPLLPPTQKEEKKGPMELQRPVATKKKA